MLAELLSSRICHDLIGPVGAVNNGIEILEEGSGEYMGEATKLIAQSARQAARRLAFFRVAFGFGGVADRQMALEDLRDLAFGMIEGSKINLHWSEDDVEGDKQVSSLLGKFLLNLILVSLDSLPRGGQVTLRLWTDNGRPGMSLRSVGKGAHLPDGLKEIVRGDSSVRDLTARNVPVYLCACLAGQLGLSVSAEEKEDETVAFSVT